MSSSSNTQIERSIGTLSMKDEPIHIQTTWTDLSNITRCQLTTKELYDSHFKKNGFSQPYFIMSLPYMDHPPYGDPAGELLFFPDAQTPQHLPWLDGAGISFGKFDDNGKPWSCCPRSFLLAQEVKLEKFGIKLGIGFELEFYLLNLDGTPVNNAGYGDTMALTGKSWKVISGAVAAMRELGLPIWKYHSEAGFGQFEISIGPFMGSMLKAADSLVLARQAIFHTAAAFGLNATFAPSPLKNFPGSSVHTHISLWKENLNLFEVDCPKGSAFLAGIHEQLPNILPVLCANGNSYDRFNEYGFCGAFHCIGTENRKAAIRVFQDGKLMKRFEVRTPDGTSNPYLAVGSLIGAGIHGIENRVQLPAFVKADPLTLSKETRPRMLPSTLADAIQKFGASEFNRKLYGDDLITAILLVRKGEEAYWSSNKETMDSKMKILLEKY